MYLTSLRSLPFVQDIAVELEGACSLGPRVGPVPSELDAIEFVVFDFD